MSRSIRNVIRRKSRKKAQRSARKIQALRGVSSAAGGFMAETVERGGRFQEQRLPFVKHLSKDNEQLARILEDSYKKGTAAAS
jgi:hypothetical protein